MGGSAAIIKKNEHQCGTMSNSLLCTNASHNLYSYVKDVFANGHKMERSGKPLPLRREAGLGGNRKGILDFTPLSYTFFDFFKF